MKKGLKPKETSVILASVFCGVALVSLLILMCFKKYITSEDIQNSILTTSGIFIGFIIAALGIYYSIPINNDVKKALKEQGYYYQISRNFIVSLISFFIGSVSCIVAMSITSMFSIDILTHLMNSLILSIFIFGLILCVFTSVNFFKVVKHNDK